MPEQKKGLNKRQISIIIINYGEKKNKETFVFYIKSNISLSYYNVSLAKLKGI